VSPIRASFENLLRGRVKARRGRALELAEKLSTVSPVFPFPQDETLTIAIFTLVIIWCNSQGQCALRWCVIVTRRCRIIYYDSLAALLLPFESNQYRTLPPVPRAPEWHVRGCLGRT
jgi:hypothetical protein